MILSQLCQWVQLTSAAPQKWFQTRNTLMYPTCVVNCCLLLYSYVFEITSRVDSVIIPVRAPQTFSWKQNSFTVASVSSTDVSCPSEMFPSEIHSCDLSFRLPAVVVTVPSRTRDWSLSFVMTVWKQMRFTDMFSFLKWCSHVIWQPAVVCYLFLNACVDKVHAQIWKIITNLSLWMCKVMC